MMLRIKFTFIAILATAFAFAQDGVIRQFVNKKLVYFSQADTNGNMLFSKNDGRNGEITMLYAADYDSLNREIRSWSAHSNIGYSMSETVYDGNMELRYDFPGDTAKVFDFTRKTLRAIDSKEAFLNMDAIKELQRGPRKHIGTKIYDGQKNLAREIYLSGSGDTTDVNLYRYNAQNKEIFFHKGDLGSESWTWDIYTVYNDHGDENQSYRLQTINGIRDTVEVRNRRYNAKNQLVSEDYYDRGKFSTKTDYFYGANDLLESELFYQEDEKKYISKTTYKYDKSGKLLKKTDIDCHLSKKGVKKVFTESP